MESKRRLCLYILSIAVLLCIQNISHAQSADKCSSSDAVLAETIASSLRTAEELHRSFVQFKHCDDGGLAEGYSESVARLLADHWDKLNELHELVRNDVAFRKFVIRHIDETISCEDTKTIHVNATQKCPKRLKEFCAEIASASNVTKSW
jgi:hypothetical protein